MGNAHIWNFFRILRRGRKNNGANMTFRSFGGNLRKKIFTVFANVLKAAQNCGKISVYSLNCGQFCLFAHLKM